MDIKEIVKPLNKIFLIFVILFISAGCANTFTRFYNPNLYNEYSFEKTQEVRSYRIGEPSEAKSYANNNGCVIVGSSDFITTGVNEKQAISHAKKIGADVVLIYSKYIGTEQGVMPMVQYIPGKTATINTYSNYHTTANIYGNNWSAYGTGNTSGTSTSFISTPATISTQYVPYSRNKYEYHVYYLRKNTFGRQVENILGVNKTSIAEIKTKESEKGVWHFTTVEEVDKKEEPDQSEEGGWHFTPLKSE